MEQTQAPGRGLRPLLSLKKHWRISVVLALVVAVAGLPAVWVKGRSEYMAEAVFQVAPNFQKTLSADKEMELQSNSQYREFVNHLSRSVVRYDVIKSALDTLKTGGTQACSPAETERQCIERLQRTIYIRPVADTYMVKVGLVATEKASLDGIVNAVMDRFLDVTRDEQIYGSDERSRVLAERSKLLRAEIEGFARQRAGLASRLGLTTFGENTVNPYDTVLAQAREKYNLAMGERSHAQAALQAFNTQREVPLSAGRSVLEMRLQDNGLQAMRNEVIRRSEELGRTMSGLEDKHPARQPAAAEQAENDRRLQSRETAFDTMAQQNVRARLNASLQQTQQVERELRDRLRELEGQASRFAADFREAMRLSAEMRKRERELDEMRDRLNFLGTERNALGFVRLITPALPAETPQGLGKTKLLAGLLLVSLLAGLLLPTVIDLLDRRVLVVGDAERAMGIASAGWLVRVKDEATRSLAQDQIRRLASTLMRNRQRGGRASCGFTSARVGGGATTLVLDLARTLTRLGSRVLVVDANSLSGSSGLPVKGAGLRAVLAGQAGADDVVCFHEHAGTRLPIVPFGEGEGEGLERLDRLRDALAHWSAQYDLVLVDIPPILPSADAELLVDAVGQVFLVAEAAGVTKRDVSKARNVLQKLDPEAVGLIVNMVDFDAAGADATAHLVETITGGRFQNFMTLSHLRLRFELLRMRLARRRPAR